MTQIDWSIVRGGADAGSAFMAGFQRSRLQSAMGALARDPARTDALAAVAEVSPDLALQWQAGQRAQAVEGRAQSAFARDERFRDALANYQTGGAGAGVLSAPLPAAPNALATPPAGGNVQGRMPGEVPQPGTLDALAADEGDIVVTGRRPVPIATPRAAGAPGWDAVVRADPVKAMDASHAMFGAREDQLKDWQHVSQVGMRMLGAVRDQESWDSGKAAARRVYQSFGVPFPDLPDEYSPEIVRDLQMQQLDVEDQIQAALNEKRFEWQREDDLLDNARADRNTDDLIRDRGARRGLTVRGQNIASADRRRGQDMTDRRMRERPVSGGRGRDASPPRVTSQADYARLPKGAAYIAPDGQTRRKN